MDFAKQLVLSFLEKIFDEPRKKRDYLTEFEFNCNSSECRHDENKFNLFYNTNKNKFHCWKCKYRGNLSDLLEKYGTEADLDIISTVIKDINKTNFKKDKLRNNESSRKELFFPEGFLYLSDYKGDNFHYKNAIKYLESRGIGEKEINKFKLGFTTKGKYKYRIIVPSYDKSRKLNYYDGRAFYPNIKPNYLKPDKEFVKKFDVIFNESNVNFFAPIYLVEGVFDMFPLFNCVPMLGKQINNVLLNKIIKYKTPVVLCLDEDAVADVVKLSSLLQSFGIEVFWCPIKNDIAKIYELQGKKGVIETLSGIKKVDTQTEMKLKMIVSKEIQKRKEDYIDKKDYQKEWSLKNGK